jgi:hypothetical protein
MAKTKKKKNSSVKKVLKKDSNIENKKALNVQNEKESNVENKNALDVENKKDSKINDLTSAKSSQKISNSEKKVVKEIDNKMAFGVIGLLGLIVLVLFYMLFFYSPYTYSFVVNDVPYYSNYYTPTSFFNTIRNEKTVYVSPMIVENDISPTVVNSMQLWNVILNLQGVNVIQLLRVYNPDFSYCQTNDGNVNASNFLTKEECQVVLNSDNWIILIEEGKTRVIIDEKKVSIFSSRVNSSVVNFSVIKEIFPDAEEAFDLINQRIYGIQ